jgi:hypothetical protein
MSETQIVTEEVDSRVARRYASSVMRMFESNSLLPDKDGEYLIQIEKDNETGNANYTVRDGDGQFKKGSLSLNDFDEIETPMRDFKEVSLRCTRDMSEYPSLEPTVITIKFANTTIRLTV